MVNALRIPQNPETLPSPGMPATGAVMPGGDASAGLGTQMPTNRQGGRGNALRMGQSSAPQAPPAPMMAPAAPAPQKKNALLSGVANLAKGFDPAAFAQGEQMAQQSKDQEREQLLGMYKQALHWTDQALGFADDAQMQQFIAQNADKIQQTTGQDMRPVLAKGVNRQELMQERAALAAQLGQSPAQAEPMSAYEAAQIELKRAEAAKADPAKEVNRQRFTSGGYQYSFNPQTQEVLPIKGPDGQHLRADEKSGVNLTFGEGGALSGLSIGGSAPKGKEAAIVRGPDGQPIVTPGPQQAGANKAYQSLQDFRAQNGIVMDDIRKAKELIGPWTTGPGAALADLPVFGKSTDAGALESRINTIKANVGFDKLQNMRENSPTGGALGSVTEREIAFLQAVFGDLDTARRQEDVEYNLNRLEEFMQGREGRLQAAFAQDYPGLAQYAGFAAGAQQQGRDLQSGAATMTATNPQTGERIQYNPETQQWEPVR